MVWATNKLMWKRGNKGPLDAVPIIHATHTIQVQDRNFLGSTSKQAIIHGFYHLLAIFVTMLLPNGFHDFGSEVGSYVCCRQSKLHGK